MRSFTSDGSHLLYTHADASLTVGFIPQHQPKRYRCVLVQCRNHKMAAFSSMQALVQARATSLRAKASTMKPAGAPTKHIAGAKALLMPAKCPASSRTLGDYARTKSSGEATSTRVLTMIQLEITTNASDPPPPMARRQLHGLLT